MRKISRTAYGSKLQTHLLLGLPFELITNSTLNEKFQVQAGVKPKEATMPALRYLCIGNGGHRFLTNADGIAYTDPHTHRASDAASFNNIPFVMREVNEDLSITERRKYALRVAETHNGVNYYAYYLKRLDIPTDTPVEMIYTTVRDGASQSTPFAPTTSNLNPKPPEIPSTGVVSTEGDYLSTSAIITISFGASDVEELLNVARILYNNENLAVISEFGLCTGVDQSVVGQASGGQQFNYLEALMVQLAMHVTDYYPVGFANEGFEFKLQVGKTEPLLQTSDGS